MYNNKLEIKSIIKLVRKINQENCNNILLAPVVCYQVSYEGYLNSGKIIETADEMKEAILPFGGSSIKLGGVSSISNEEHHQEGLRVWKAYNIGSGKLIPWKKTNVPNSAELFHA